MSINIRGFDFYDGQPVFCFFANNQVIQGILHVLEHRFFICHNEDVRHGSTSPEMFGCRASWVFEYSKAKDRFTQDVQDMKPVTSDVKFKKIQLSEELRHFLNIVSLSKLDIIFQVIIKPFDYCTHFELSEKKGFITMSGDVETPKGKQKKTVEIKLARFIKRIIDSNDFCKQYVSLTDKDIEDINNDLVSFQENSYFDIEFSQGKEILEGYKLSNYSKSNTSGTIYKSCMTNKLDFLSLYTENPEHVKLAYLKSRNGIEARCLVWKIDDEFYYDRIYTTMDWLDKTMKRKLKELGYHSLQDAIDAQSYLRIDLTNHQFDSYPYLDSFKFLNMKTGAIFAANHVENLPYKVFRKLISTSGGFEIARKYQDDDE